MGLASNFKEWRLQLYNRRLDKPVDDDAGSYQVYTAGSPARQTIYDSAGTTLTQAVAFGNYVSRTLADGVLRFFTASTCTAVDISVLTNGGRAYFLKNVSQSQGRVDVDPERSDYELIVAIDDKASSTAQRQLGFTARKGMKINDVFVRTVTAFTGAATAANALNLGVAGDSDAFTHLLDVSAVGYHQILVHSTTGKIFATQFAGVQLANWNTASNATAPGWFTRKPYFVPTATALTVSRGAALTASMTAQAGKGYVFYCYTLDPTITTAV